MKLFSNTFLRHSFLFTFALAVFLSCNHLYATNYYVDAINGNDNNTGTTNEKAWQTLKKASSITYKPGDKILLKAGCTFKGQLHPKGSGSAGAPIIIDRYGEGKRPILDGGGSSDDGGFYGHAGKAGNVVHLLNQEYWEISNLEITNHGKKADYRRGLRVEITDMGQCHHIHIKNVYVHDINGLNKSKGKSHHELSKQTGGIFLCVTGDDEKTRFVDVLIDGCTVKNCDRSGISVGARKHWYKHWNQLIDPKLVDSRLHLNVIIRNNFIDDVGGDGIVIQYAKDPLIEYNVCKDAAKRSYKQGQFSAGVWPWMCENALFQFNEVYKTHSRLDGQGFDCDSGRGTIYQYNYSHDNEGGFMLFCQGGSQKSIVRYNISQNDHFALFTNSGGTAEVYNNIFFIGKGMTTKINTNHLGGKMKIYNNIFYNEGKVRNPKWGKYEYRNNVFYGFDTTPNDPQKIIADPQLKAPGTGGTGIITTFQSKRDQISKLDGYKLKPGSPCIGKGKPIGQGRGNLLDFWKRKINMKKVNIGADETPAP